MKNLLINLLKGVLFAIISYFISSRMILTLMIFLGYNLYKTDPNPQANYIPVTEQLYKLKNEQESKIR